MVPRIRTVQIRNYKSLASVSVNLDPLTVLVGPNASGKSNFIDALAFVQQCVAGSVKHAVRDRGGLEVIRHGSTVGRSTQYQEPAAGQAGNESPGENLPHLGFRLILELTEDYRADYAFEIPYGPLSAPADVVHVARERCVVEHNGQISEFETQAGHFVKEIPGIRPKVDTGKLALSYASRVEEYIPLYEFVSSMRFYWISPSAIREWRDRQPAEYLDKDGGNAPAILQRMELESQSRPGVDLVSQFLGALVEGITEVRYKAFGPKETILFRQVVSNGATAEFYPDSMSDGTLRITGLLLAAFQPGYSPFIAIEEPEATIHPALAESVLEVLISAAYDRQVLITTHSADLLDQKDLSHSNLRVAQWKDGQTMIGSISGTDREAIRENLYSAGELLRIDELNLNVTETERAARSVDLFGSPFSATGNGT